MRLIRGVAAGLAIAGFCALSVSIAAAQDINALYEAAKKEGALTLYGGGRASVYEERAKNFTDKYPGIKVSVVGGFSNQLTAQIDDARKSGKPHADVAMLQTIQDFVKWKNEGALMSFKPEGWDVIYPEFKDPDGMFVGYNVQLIAYTQRSDLLKEPIRSAKDFLNPALKGKTVSTYPHDDDITLYHYAKLVDRYGWEFMEQYMKNEPQFVQGHLGVAQKVSSGEAVASLDHFVSMTIKSDVVIPTDEPSTVFGATMAIFKDAPHPNAAKLYVNWFMSKEASVVNTGPGRWSTRSDVAPYQGFKPFSEYKTNDDFQRFITQPKPVLDALRQKFKSYTGDVKGPEFR